MMAFSYFNNLLEIHKINDYVLQEGILQDLSVHIDKYSREYDAFLVRCEGTALSEAQQSKVFITREGGGGVGWFSVLLKSILFNREGGTAGLPLLPGVQGAIGLREGG